MPCLIRAGVAGGSGRAIRTTRCARRVGVDMVPWFTLTAGAPGSGRRLSVHTSFSLRSKASATSVFLDFSVAKLARPF